MDDTSFYSGGEEFQNNINKIMSEYEKLYEATGSLVEYQKSHCYVWQWKWVQGKEIIVNIKIDVKIHKYIIKQIKSLDTIRALGVFINPSLTWNEHFRVIV